MSVGRCHSAFQHYEMFHGHGACHGGGNNYGSIFNINYNCSGRHGNFWTGLAGGLGYGIGSWFMGGLNMLGGWLGLGGGMGFGGMGLFGMPMFNWGNNTAAGVRNYNNDYRNTERVIEKVTPDADYAKINELSDEVTQLEQNPERTQEDIDELSKKIDEFKKADDINTQENNDHLQDLKERLTKLSSAPVDDDVDKDPKTINFEDADNIDTLMQKLPEGGYDKLSTQEKAAFNNKLGELLKGMSASEKLNLLKDKDTDSAVRAKIKATFYAPNFTNYDGSTVLNNGDVMLAHDASGNTRDTKMVENKSEVTKAENGNHPQTIVIHDSKDITYTYKETIDGEYIYVSDQDKQEYVLQKNGDKYYLQQYEYHKGYGEKDWSPA